MITTHTSADKNYSGWGYWVAAIAFVSFVAGIWNQPFIDFEVRFALFAKEMLRNGISLFPTTYGRPYADYPVTSTLLIYGFAKLFGFFNKFVAILPTALAATGVVTLSFLLLARYSLLWALGCICLEWATFTFLSESRSISLDQMMALVCIATFYLIHTAEQRSVQRTRFGIIALFIAGFLIRGPIGVILPNAVLASHLWLNKGFKAFLAWSTAAVAVIVVLWALQLGLAWQQGGPDFVSDVIRMQVTERMSLEDYEPFYYYFTSSFGNYAPSFPLFMLVCVALFWNRKHFFQTPHYRLVLSLMLWVALILVGLSIPHTKKVRYLVPMLPALCAVVAYPLAVSVSPRLTTFLKISLSCYPAFLACILLYGKSVATAHGITFPAGYTATLVILLSLQCGIIVTWIWQRAQSVQVASLFIAAALASWTTWSVVAAPTLEKMHNTADFVMKAEQIRANQPAPLVFYKIGKDGMAIKYMVNLEHAELPQFAHSEEALAFIPKPVYLLMEVGKEKLLSEAFHSHASALLTGNFDKTQLTLYYLQ